MIFRLVIDPNKEESVVATVHAPSQLTSKIEGLVLEENGRSKIPGYREDQLHLLSFEDIVCITVIDGKTYAVDKNGEQYRLKLRLYEVEALLPSYFIRINKSAIANENRIERFHAGYSGAVDVVFHGGYREYVSRRCFAAIKRRFQL